MRKYEIVLNITDELTSLSCNFFYLDMDKKQVKYMITYDE